MFCVFKVVVGLLKGWKFGKVVLKYCFFFGEIWVGCGLVLKVFVVWVKFVDGKVWV